MRAKYRKTLTGLAALTATAGTVWVATTVAPLSASAAEVADEPPSLVEDYQYPGAAQILADTQNRIRLVSGDGHIVYGACATAPATGTGRIVVWTSNDDAPVCFDVLGPNGLLNLEVAAVYEIDARRSTGAGATAASAKVTEEDGEVTPVQLSLERSTQVGVGGDTGAEPATLLQLAVRS